MMVTLCLWPRSSVRNRRFGLVTSLNYQQSINIWWFWNRRQCIANCLKSFQICESGRKQKLTKIHFSKIIMQSSVRDKAEKTGKVIFCVFSCQVAERTTSFLMLSHCCWASLQELFCKFAPTNKLCSVYLAFSEIYASVSFIFLIDCT